LSNNKTQRGCPNKVYSWYSSPIIIRTINKNEMNGAGHVGSTGLYECVQNLLENLTGTDHFKGLGADGRIILK
jgi:hypothetical protein